MTIVRAMPERLPDDARFGFNTHHETRRAWIVVEEGADAERLVNEILTSSE